MALELLMQEVQGLSDDTLMEVVRFIKFIKAESADQRTDQNPAVPENRKADSKVGLYRGQIWISDDFDAPILRNR